MEMLNESIFVIL